jgi:hypothetical protein
MNVIARIRAVAAARAAGNPWVAIIGPTLAGAVGMWAVARLNAYVDEARTELAAVTAELEDRQRQLRDADEELAGVAAMMAGRGPVEHERLDQDQAHTAGPAFVAPDITGP